MDAEASAPLSQRYGDARRPRRLQVASLALLLVGGLAWALWAGLASANKDLTWQVDRFSTGPQTVVINFTLHRRGDFVATCTFRARGRDGAVVGRASLDIPVSRRSQVSSVYTLTTSAPPVTGEIEVCTHASGR